MCSTDVGKAKEITEQVPKMCISFDGETANYKNQYVKSVIGRLGKNVKKQVNGCVTSENRIIDAK